MKKLILMLAILAITYPVYLPYVSGGNPLYDAITMSCGFQPYAPMRIGCHVWSAAEFEAMPDAINFVWGDVQLNGRVLKASACGATDDEIEQLWASWDGLTFWHLYRRGGVYSNCYKLYSK